MELQRQQQEITPPSTPTLEENIQGNFIEDESDAGPSRQSVMGKRTARRKRIILGKRVKQLEEQFKLANMKKQKYKKRITRLKKQIKNTPETPNKKVLRMTKNIKVTPEIKRNLLFGEVMKHQIKKNFSEKKRY